MILYYTMDKIKKNLINILDFFNLWLFGNIIIIWKRENLNKIIIQKEETLTLSIISIITHKNLKNKGENKNQYSTNYELLEI